MAGGKLDIERLSERREGKLLQIQKYLDKIYSLQLQAEELDNRIMNNCSHPEKFLKIQKFTKSFPQDSIWLCQLCYQVIDDTDMKQAREKLKEKIKKDITSANANIKPRGPVSAIRRIKGKN